MSKYITDEMVEKAAKAMADDWNPERDPILTAMFRDYAATALDAAAPLIADQALRNAADETIRLVNGAAAQALREAIAHVSDDAAMDAWWEACDDAWAVPDYLPAQFLRHWFRARADRIEKGES